MTRNQKCAARVHESKMIVNHDNSKHRGTIVRWPSQLSCDSMKTHAFLKVSSNDILPGVDKSLHRFVQESLFPSPLFLI